MPKYIDADAVLVQMKNRRYFVGRRSDPVCIIEDMPAADVEPVRNGHWIMYAYDEAICSACGYDRGTEFESTKEAKERWDSLPMWCEGCGAKMLQEPPKMDKEKAK